MNSLYIWGAIFVLALVVEVATAGLATIWFAGGALVAFILKVLEVPLIWQVLAFVVISLLLLAFTRPMAVKYLNRKTEKTNILDSIIGRSAIVTEEINNILATGRVTLDGMPWTARSLTEEQIIPVGREVIVENIVGVKCIVKEMENKEAAAEKVQEAVQEEVAE